MSHEPLDAAGLEELRRAVEECDRHSFAPTMSNVRASVELAEVMRSDRHRILAALEHRETMLRRMAKGPAGPAPAEGEIRYFNRPI